MIKIPQLYTGFIQGAKAVMAEREYLNKINIFPIPDGDTGSNLYVTMESIILHSKVENTIKSTCASFSDSALLGARGNSGLIFAQYIQGFHEGLPSNTLEIDIDNYLEATSLGVTRAHEAVEEPVTGTILSVMQNFCDYLSQKSSLYNDLSALLQSSLDYLDEEVNKTTTQMDLLKQAHVVDSGAEGFAAFIKGFTRGIQGIDTPAVSNIIENSAVIFDRECHDFQQPITYRYCTEILIQNNEHDITITKEDIHTPGDSLVIGHSSSFTRIHLHTNAPYDLVVSLKDKGRIVQQKVEDMFNQQNLIEKSTTHDTVIVTDSVSDLPDDLLLTYPIHILSLPIILGDHTYVDRHTIRNTDVINSDESCSSSQLSLIAISHAYDFLMTYYKNIIVLSISSKLSGTYRAFCKAAETYNDKTTRIHVFDTRQNSIAQGLLVYELAQLLGHKSLDYLLRKIKKFIDNSKILVTIESLDPMIQCGRISPTVGKMAKKLSLLPVITLDDAGKGAIYAPVFSSRQGLKKICKRLKKIHTLRGILSYAITHVENPDVAERTAKELTKLLGFPPQYIAHTSTIVAKGSGQGTIGVGYIEK